MKTTRIDIFNYQDKLTVKKYTEGWNVNSRPAQISTPQNFTYQDILEWLKNEGWEVFEWESCPIMGVPEGARGYLGKPRPVRSRWEIKKLRDHYVKLADAYFSTPASYHNKPSLINRLHAIDLAYIT